MMLQTTCRTAIEQEVIKNLLLAQKRIADHGDAKEVIRVSRFLLRLAQKKGDILLSMENRQEGGIDDG